MKTRVLSAAVAACAIIAIITAACGGGSPSGPSSSTTTSVANPATTFTISNNTVSPKTLTVPAGTRVTFINNDNRSHDMESDPHPEHNDCPEINQVGFLSAGQSKETGNLNTVRTCGFHDHGLDTVESLKGSIIIR